MNQEEYQEASEYWSNKEADCVRVPEEELMHAMEEFIQANNTCALATGYNGFVRCTPIEYTYRDGTFWLFSEGGLKFIGLEHNSSVSIAIYESYEGFGRLKGMQVSGDAVIVEPYSKDYVSAAEYKKIPIEALKKLAHPMNLIRIKPVRIDFLNSEFKENGYSSRQWIEFE